jgi:hypothetical protein
MIEDDLAFLDEVFSAAQNDALRYRLADEHKLAAIALQLYAKCPRRKKLEPPDPEKEKLKKQGYMPDLEGLV